LDSPVNDEDVVHYALEGLSDKYDQVCGVMHHKDTFPVLKTARSMLITEEMRLKSKFLSLPMDSSSSSPLVLMAESGHFMISLLQLGIWIQLGKHVRLPFVSYETVVIHSDVWTSPILILPGFKYYIQCEIRSFQCGHGGEFDNRTQHKLFVDNGIQFRFSCPKTSQQNNGTLSRYKARLVSNGSTQLEGVDVDEIFSPVVKPSTIRTVLSLATIRHWPVHQLDVKNAFLHGDLSEMAYMHQPSGFRDSVYPDYVCLLQRLGINIAYLLLYVDDIVLIASFETLMQHVIGWLHHEFSMTDLGSHNYFLGISVTRDSSRMFLSQKKYVVEIIKRAHMVNCNPSQTPVDTESKLGDDCDPVSDPTMYRSLAGSLQYLTFTRPNISYAVQRICLYMHDPREPHLSALRRILRYVRGTLDYGLQLFSSSTTDLVAYSDADWAGCPTTRGSTSGYCVFLGNNLLSWSSKRQPTLSRSSAEAEYRGVANDVAETCWLRNLLRELHTPLSSATLVYCDNVSVVYLSCNPVQHQRTKHIEIDIHFVRDLIAVGQVRVLHVLSRYQYAHIFTKGLPLALFEEFRTSLSARCPPAPTAREC
ncbi:ribonuclease H-like domain-containing protein, partial [Tanacetum coccineum]